MIFHRKRQAKIKLDKFKRYMVRLVMDNTTIKTTTALLDVMYGVPMPMFWEDRTEFTPAVPTVPSTEKPIKIELSQLED